jgi:hypothetical protein
LQGGRNSLGIENSGILSELAQALANITITTVEVLDALEIVGSMICLWALVIASDSSGEQAAALRKAA